MVTKFKDLYKKDITEQEKRYDEIKNGFAGHFGDNDNIEFFSAPGRTEIGGNHTDHNHGRVFAAAVDLDIVAAARKTDNNTVTVKSIEYTKEDIIDIKELSVKDDEIEKSASIIRGICARCAELGYKIGGFQAFTKTNVLKGSGLSSSAAFEVVIVTIISHLFNDGSIDPVTAAQIAQYAENVYFGKPSGLLDQMASSVGKSVAVDFKDTDNPKITPVSFDLNKYEHALCVVDTGGNHADLTGEYAAIPQEMKKVASYFGKDYLRDIPYDEFYNAIAELRKKYGDRAVLRSMHFYDDDLKAAQEAEAIENDDFDTFLSLINASGYSSETKLQNVFATVSPQEQGPSLALAVSRKILNGSGACRVHGGGFAGTIQAFVPFSLLEEYKTGMKKIFGDGSCYILSIREAGGTKVEF